MKNLIIILTLICSSRAFSSSGQFCASPYSYTCSNDEAPQVREANINAIEEEIKNRAFNLLQTDSAEDEVISQLTNYNEIENLTPARTKKHIQKLFYAQIRQVFLSYMEQNQVPSDLGVTAIKATLLNSINADQTISDDTKTKISTLINQVRLISFNSDLDESTVGDVHALYKTCMKKGFVDNAFATEVKKEKVIIVCPGEIIGTIEDLRSRNIGTEYTALAMAMTLGHEFSHHFDFRYYPELYTNLFNDVKKYQNYLKKSPEKYMSEISADFWGLKVFKALTSSIFASPLYDQLAAASLNDLCGSSDDGEHPPGDFRINLLAYQHLCY